MKYGIVNTKEGLKFEKVNGSNFIQWGYKPEDVFRDVYSIRFKVGNVVINRVIRDENSAQVVANILLNNPSHIIENIEIKLRNSSRL